MRFLCLFAGNSADLAVAMLASGGQFIFGAARLPAVGALTVGRR